MSSLFLKWRWLLAETICPEQMEFHRKMDSRSEAKILAYMDFCKGVRMAQDMFPKGDLSLELNPLFTELDINLSRV